jgi:hypothetical protein
MFRSFDPDDPLALDSGNPGSSPGQALTTDPVTGKSYSYWAIDNQLKNVASPYLTLGYDALSRLRYDTHGSTVTNYVSDGTDIVAEYDNAGGLLARFAFGGMGEPLAAYDSSGARSWTTSS